MTPSPSSLPTVFPGMTVDTGVVNQHQSLPQGRGCPPCLDLGITWAKALKQPSDARAPLPDSDLIGPEDSNAQTRQRIIIPAPGVGVGWSSKVKTPRSLDFCSSLEPTHLGRLLPLSKDVTETETPPRVNHCLPSRVLCYCSLAWTSPSPTRESSSLP